MSQAAGYPQASPGPFAGQAPYYAQQQQYPPTAGYNAGNPSSQYSNFAPQAQSYPPQFAQQQQQQQQQQQPTYQQGYPPQFGWQQQQAPQQPGPTGSATSYDPFQTQSQQAQNQPQPPQQQQQQTQDQASGQPQQNAPQTNQIDKNLDPLGWALAEYGSPFAHSKDWRASPSDVELTGIPQQKLMMRVKQRFARSPGDVWSQPPPSFGRAPQQGWSYAPFQPFSLPAAGEQLADGFKSLYLGRVLADHDVSAADWARFLEDITVAGRMTGGQRIIAGFAPVTMHMGATGFLVTKALEKRMKRKKEPAVAETVEMWEQNFFLRRGLDVYVRDNEGRITGFAPGEPLPGSNNAKPVELEGHSSHDDSDDDSSDSDSHDHKLSHKEKKKEREERKKKRKAEEKKKKEERKKNKKKPKFYLIVAPYQPM